MPNTPAPRFQHGDLVDYLGSLQRCHGLKRVISVVLVQGQPRYGLHDEVWGGIIRNVREASLRGPEDD